MRPARADFGDNLFRVLDNYVVDPDWAARRRDHAEDAGGGRRPQARPVYAVLDRERLVRRARARRWRRR
ncbi:MAG: hypothetical protein U5K74_10770 [Gemmatimonadaceae bacterium]|nr:hypothetical protein [Gemmatimonadaceae bacterium]